MKYLNFVLILTFLILISCNNHSQHKNHDQNKVEQKSIKYICPMHPQITSDKSGQCSICGMDLVLHIEDDNEEDNDNISLREKDKSSGIHEDLIPEGRSNLKLSLDKEQLIGVKVTKVQVIELFKTVRAPGRIAFDPELYTAQSEYVEALRQWQRVKNSPLAEVKRSTNEMIKSSKIRLQVLGLSPDQVRKIGRRGNVSESLIVGDGKGDNLIYADVFESDLSKIKPGQSVVVEGSFLEGKKIAGKVISVDQVIDPKTRTGKVRVSIEKTKASIRPEAFVNVSIAVPLGKHTSVSLESVFDTGRDLYVYIAKGNGSFEPRKITRIFETDDHMAISSGVSEGENIVVSANFLIDSESRLKAVIKSSGNQKSHNH